MRGCSSWELDWRRRDDLAAAQLAHRGRVIPLADDDDETTTAPRDRRKETTTGD